MTIHEIAAQIHTAHARAEAVPDSLGQEPAYRREHEEALRLERVLADTPARTVAELRTKAIVARDYGTPEDALSAAVIRDAAALAV